MEPVLDVPVMMHQGEQLLGPGAFSVGRGEAPGHLNAALAGS